MASKEKLKPGSHNGERLKGVLNMSTINNHDRFRGE
jgi:hypothetical protein